jgi:hypothetical protein
VRPSVPILTAVTWMSISCIGQVRPAASQQGTPTRYDGRWWLSVSPREQSGFVAGYVDCYADEYKGPARFQHKSLASYRNLITQHFEGNSSRQNERVSEVLYQLRDRTGEKGMPAGGEVSRGRHSYFDGLYWMQISVGGHDEQLGFVEGFLSCYVALPRDQSGVLSKMPEEYRSLISQWYRFDERSGDIDASRQPEKIADVLLKFRDPPAKRSGNPPRLSRTGEVARG